MSYIKRVILIAAATLSLSGLGYAETKIAVTDLSYKKEVREFFYYEAANSKSSVSAASSYEAAGYDRVSKNKAVAVEANRSDSIASGGGGVAASSSGSFKGSSAESYNRDAAFAAKGSSAYSSNKQSSYVKTYGDKVRIEYTQLVGMSGEIRAALIKAGFSIVQARPIVAKPNQNDSFFDIVKRIKSGEYDGADYVLYGVVAALDTRSNREHVDGTDSYVDQYEMLITVDYSLIDTKTLQAKSAFTVTASGNDNRIVNGKSGQFTPSTAKIMGSMAKSLGEEVTIKLADQGFIDLPSNLQLPSKVAQPYFKDDPKSVKVFQ